MLKTGPWYLKDLDNIPKNGLKVFSCFHCGGGSTMGYKLAGYDVLGGVEIDPEMMQIYRTNHKPKYSYLMGVQDFKNIPNAELPQELFDLDILDGSPPCSSFSMAGSREKKWGTNTHFREGQAKQILDDLFFDFIAIASKLQPKIVIAENVKGLIQGNAKGYVKKIFEAFCNAGYETQLFLLDSSFMGVPQKRERVFFVARQKNLKLNNLVLSFNEKPISVGYALQGCKLDFHPNLRPSLSKYWKLIPPGKSVADVNGTGSSFTRIKINPCNPAPTQNADLPAMHWSEKRHLCRSESLRLQTFPDDFICPDNLAHYVCGMSVPPFMAQRIAHEIEKQWFK